MNVCDRSKFYSHVTKTQKSPKIDFRKSATRIPQECHQSAAGITTQLKPAHTLRN